jgi:hypothetical protein
MSLDHHIEALEKIQDKMIKREAQSLEKLEQEEKQQA